jgi:hypothetical protein
MALSHNHAHEFQRIFGVSLTSYLNKITGFDIIKFDEFVRPKKNESTADALRRRWGQEAVNLVRALIHMPPEEEHGG